jgi:hypothetical protein
MRFRWIIMENGDRDLILKNPIFGVLIFYKLCVIQRNLFYKTFRMWDALPHRGFFNNGTNCRFVRTIVFACHFCYSLFQNRNVILQFF